MTTLTAAANSATNLTALPRVCATEPTRQGDPPAAARPRQVTVHADDGTRLACHDYGHPDAAHTIVFLHGLCLNSTSWTSHISRLTRRYGTALRIIAYDHRGHGHSAEAPVRSYTITRLAADLSTVLRALRVRGPLTLIGHSMGGMTALAYLDQPAQLRPVEPTGLVLIATAAGKLAEHGVGRLLAAPGATTLLTRAAQAPEPLIRAFVKPMCTLLAHLGDHFAATTLASVTLNALTTTPPRTALGFLPSLRTYNVHASLPRISARTVIVSGNLDPLTPTTHSRHLAAAIPGAHLINVVGGGHMLPQQAPDVIQRAVTEAITVSHERRNRRSPTLPPNLIPTLSVARTAAI